NLTLSGRVVSETCNTGMVNKQPLQRCGKIPIFLPRKILRITRVVWSLVP
ncbi:DUF2574 family protein, partial [Klebsiella quasipneumoniae]|nr:DUF2574 family protein [Klebsiella quasipneumoniae]